MKVCQINATYGFGSTGLIAKEINDLALSNQIETLSCAQYSNCDSFIIGNKLDWKFHALFTRAIGKQGYASRLPTRKLIKYLRKERPDLVHLHNLHSNYINLKMLFKFLAESKTNVVITLHDCWFFTGKCFHFVETNCDNWQNYCHNCPQKHHSINSLFFDQSKKVFFDKKKLYESCSKLTVVGCSNWITSLAKRSPLLRNANILCIHNGVDTSIFNINVNSESMKQKYQLNNKFVILCFANKLLNSKNEDIKNKLMNSLCNDYILLVVGCSKRQIEILGHYQNVTCVEYIENQKTMSELYKSADVFINLTLADTLPTVNMESICCGTPVVTYNSCGSPELIEEGKTGFVINQFDFDSLMDRINKIKSGYIDRKECSLIGVNSFDKNKQYQNYVDLYKELVK